MRALGDKTGATKTGFEATEVRPRKSGRRSQATKEHRPRLPQKLGDRAV